MWLTYHDFLGTFGPQIVELVSRTLNVPKNMMLMACPNGPFPHNVASLGGVRVITATHHQTKLSIEVQSPCTNDDELEVERSSIRVDDGTPEGAVVNATHRALV